MNGWFLSEFVDIQVVSSDYKILFWSRRKLLLETSAEGGDLIPFAWFIFMAQNLRFLEFLLFCFLRVSLWDS
jgi:hypothetical protein